MEKVLTMSAIIIFGLFPVAFTINTTTEVPTTTTTAEPTTAVPTTASTTTLKPTATPKPIPYPAPSVGFWTMTDGTTKEVCIIAQFAMQLNISYAATDNTTKFGLYNLPVNQTADAGNCGNLIEELTIKWDVANQTDTLTIKFAKNETDKSFRVSALTFKILISGDSFPNAKESQVADLYFSGNELHAPLDMSYHCNRIQKFNLTDSTTNSTDIKGYVDVSHLQLEAFRQKKTSQFSTAQDCDARDSPDIVPIAVGCALAALIVVVLIAYLVGRRRSQARGYLSM